MFVRFIHIFADGCSSFISVTICIYLLDITQFIYSLLMTIGVESSFLVIRNVVITHLPESFGKYLIISVAYVPRSEMAGSYDLQMFSFNKYCHPVFQSSCNNVPTTLGIAEPFY